MYPTGFLAVMGDLTSYFAKNSSKKRKSLYSITETAIIRAYPNNPLYCGRLQSPMPALSAKNVLNVEKTTPLSIFGLPPWPRTFRSAL